MRSLINLPRDHLGLIFFIKVVVFFALFLSINYCVISYYLISEKNEEASTLLSRYQELILAVEIDQKDLNEQSLFNATVESLVSSPASKSSLLAFLFDLSDVLPSDAYLSHLECDQTRKRCHIELVLRGEDSLLRVLKVLESSNEFPSVTLIGKQNEDADNLLATLELGLSR
jgi:hypothetical protein